MTILSNSVNRIQPSQTIFISNKASEMKAAGQDVISLGAGEPDFDTPENIKGAAIAAIHQGKTKYTAVDGILELKEAIRAKFLRDNKLAYSSSQVTVASGGKQILYNALMSTVNPGDEIIIPAPYWVSYPDMTRMAGGVPKIIATTQQTGFKLTPNQLDAAITTKTKWVIINSPSNPTGTGYSREEIKALTDVLVHHQHVWIMTDDIYEHITYDDFEFCTAAEVEPELYDRTLTCNGVSKSYSMTGWRIGFAAGPEILIKAMQKVQSQSTSNPCSVSQWASLEALNGPQEFITSNNLAFKRRRNLVLKNLNAINGMRCLVPDGAFYVFPSIFEFIGKKTPKGTSISDDLTFAAALLDEAEVAVVFGSAFGLSPYFRISYACSDDILSEACARLGEFCHNLR
ncbi:MAG: pyridoxal phosphate-dependent aminotransferase [Aestuariivita sp.]|nr:pyridoxal phosphate-dependent aminotransferase [Aestuariivita sp.]